MTTNQPADPADTIRLAEAMATGSLDDIERYENHAANAAHDYARRLLRLRELLYDLINSDPDLDISTAEAREILDLLTFTEPTT